jgi:lipoate-protein ligase B
MTAPAPRRVEVVTLPGLTPYRDALALQLERRDAVIRGEAQNALFLVEHPPVITQGRNTRVENLLKTPAELDAMGIAVAETDRGGDVTYHGPGQLVAYPVLNLAQWRPSIRWYLRTLEQTLIRQLHGYSLKAERSEGRTGVWVRGGKVAAIGVGLRRWVTYHGVALNVAPDMRHFACIVPCGIGDAPVTSLTELLPDPPALERSAADFRDAFLAEFGAIPA